MEIREKPIRSNFYVFKPINISAIQSNSKFFFFDKTGMEFVKSKYYMEAEYKDCNSMIRETLLLAL